MNYSLRDNKHQNHNFRKMKNYMKIEGFRKVFFRNVCRKLLGTQNLIANIGFLKVKIKCSPNVNKTFPQRLGTLFCNICQKRLGTQNMIANIGFTVPRRCFFCGSFLLFIFRVCRVVLSVHCCLAATCWERADLLGLVCDVLLCFWPLSHVVSWVRCGTRLHRFLILATFSYFVTIYYGLDSLKPLCELNIFVLHQQQNLE